MNYLKQIKENPKLVFDYLQGEIRWYFYQHIPFLIREHIREQFMWRSSEALACVINGSCLSCGCKTPSLFMANKGCSLGKYPEKVRINMVGHTKVCYGKMMNKKEWLNFKQVNKL